MLLDFAPLVKWLTRKILILEARVRPPYGVPNHNPVNAFRRLRDSFYRKISLDITLNYDIIPVYEILGQSLIWIGLIFGVFTILLIVSSVLLKRYSDEKLEESGG